MICLNESLTVGYRSRGNNVSFEYHSHQEYEVYFFHAGSCRYLIHNQIYDLEPGDILLMNGLTLHKPNVHPHSEYVRSVLHFSPQWIQGILKEMGSEYLLDAFEKLPYCFIRPTKNKYSKKLEEIVRKMEGIKSSEIG